MNVKKDSFFINEVKNGNIDAFKFLVEKHKDMIYTIVMRIVRIREDAEEIAQDAFIKAFQSIDLFEGKSEFSTWIYKIAYNLSISHIRKKKYKNIEIDDNLISDNDIFETYNDFIKLEESERNRILKNAVNSLNEDDALIITLFYIKEISVNEIEEITNLSKSNIKIKLFRARKQLFSILKDKKELIYTV
ncbi:MAG: sigma-70 family RNA polymerase sigma factor [Chlorobi bacterium]|nr:sigma-70 family RNA polymerase sigma factor [Chlorobiota bacterium]